MKKLFALATVLIILATVALYGDVWRLQLRVWSARDPIEAAVILVLRTDEAKPRIERSGNDIDITYSITPWLLKPKMMRRKLEEQATQMFHRVYTIPSFDRVKITATSNLTDTRGQISEEELASATMFRETAASINWVNLRAENLLKVANSSHLHYSLDRKGW